MTEGSKEQTGQGSFNLGETPTIPIGEDTLEHADSLTGPGRRRLQRQNRERAQSITPATSTDAELKDKPLPERFTPGHHLLHIFDRPLAGTAWEGVLTGENDLLAVPNGETFHVRGMDKPIYEAEGPFTLESIKDKGTTECGTGTRFYRRPYKPSKAPPGSK